MSVLLLVAWLAEVKCWQLQVWVHRSLARAAGLDQSMPAWPSDKRLPGLVSCNEGDKKLACLGAPKKTAEWLGGGQRPVARLDSAWDLPLGDRACQDMQFGPL